VEAAAQHIAVEARLTGAGGRTVFLDAPPAGGGTRVAGFAATDDRGVALPVQRTGGGYAVVHEGPGAVRFRYRLSFTDSVSSGSTASGLDSARLYAVTRGLFVAPDPVLLRKTGGAYPAIRVVFILPPAWTLVSAWDSAGPALAPRSGDDLLDGTLAAAGDYRTYADTAGGARFALAIRGTRGFSDSALLDVVAEGLRRGAETFGPVPVPHVTYISDTGRKGRTSGSLQGKASIGLLWEKGELLERARSHDVFHETLHLWMGGVLETERWWTEGADDYFAARLYAEWRQDPAELAALCWQSLRNYEGIPRHLTTTMAAEARLRPGGDNTQLLVYRKGMLAALLLDAAIRKDSHGRRSLDDVARSLLALAAARGRTVSEAEIGAAVAEAGGSTAAREWRRVVAGTDAITAGQVAAALRVVTGVAPPPPPQPVEHPKTLSRTPTP